VLGGDAFVGLQANAVDDVADFGKVNWVHVTLDGSPLGSDNIQGYDMVTHPNHPKPLVFTSPLSPSGESFTNTWVRRS
jgi:hypothetical protein